jgi:peptide/nickel transport system permease protein
MPSASLDVGDVGFGSGGTSPPPLRSDDEMGMFSALGDASSGTLQKRSFVSQLDVGFWIAAAICLLWILAAVFAGLLPLDSPTIPDVLGLKSHPLGTDQIGLDTLARCIYGARVSLVVGFASIAIGLAVGGTLGIVAGYFKGWFDQILRIVTNVFLSFPYLVLGLALVTYFGRAEFTVTMIIAIVAWPLLFRVVRAATIEYSQKEYVLAAQALGSKPTRILRTLVLPDVIPAAITYGLLGVPLAIIAEGALSFLGQSVHNPTPTWGNMIYEGFIDLQQPHLLGVLIYPSICMFSFILPINYVGDKLRQVIDVRQGVL